MHDSKIDSVKQILKSVSVKYVENSYDKSKINKIDNLWAGSYFFKNVLSESTICNQLTDVKITEIIDNYNSENKTDFSYEQLLKDYYLRKVAGFIFIPGSIKYFDIEKNKDKIDDSNNLEKIKLVKKINEENKPELRIKISDFDKIYEKHISVFNSTPAIDDFFKQYILITKADYYILNISEDDRESYFYILSVKIAALYWEELYKKSESKNEIIYQWLSKVRFLYNWVDAPLYLSNDSKKNLLDCLVDIIKNADDLIGRKNEYEKVKIDFNDGFFSRYNFPLPDDVEKISVFDLYKIFYYNQLRFDPVYFSFNQNSRKIISNIIFSIIKYDNTDHKNNYKRIINLIKMFYEMLYLAYTMPALISYHCIEIIPYLLKDFEFCSFGLILLKQFMYSNQLFSNIIYEMKDKLYDLKEVLWENSLDIVFNAIVNSNDNSLYHDYSNIIYEILNLLFSEEIKIKLSNNNYYLKDNYILLNTTTEKIFTFNFYKNKFNGDFPKLLITLSRELFLVISNKINENIKKEQISFDVSDYKLLFWLFESVLKYDDKAWNISKRFNESLPKKQKFEDELLNLIIDFYQNELNRDTYKAINEGKKEEYVVKFRHDSSIIETYSWEEILLLLEKQNSIDKLLNSVNFKDKIKRYSKLPDHQSGTTTSHNLLNSYGGKEDFRKSIVGRIRLHLSLFVSFFEKISENNLIEEEIKNNILKALENTIKTYLYDFTKDDFDSGNINVFSSLFENSSFLYISKPLFPRISKIINQFNEENLKELIIYFIEKDRDPIKLFILADNIVSESIKSNILESLDKIELEDHMKKQIWIPEFEKEIFYALNLKRFDIVKKILDFGNKNSSINRLWNKIAVKTELKLAYYENDKIKLNRIELPKELKNDKDFIKTIEDLKSFYEALLSLDDNPQITIDILNKLEKSSIEELLIKINTFAAELSLAKKEENKSLIIKALEKWEKYEKRLNPNEFKQIEDTVTQNKLFAYIEIEDKPRFEILWNTLTQVDKMNINNIHLGCEYYSKTGKPEKAIELIDNAIRYHKNDEITKKLDEIRKDVDEKKLKNKPIPIDKEILTIYSLQNSFNRIKSHDSRELIKIISHSKNLNEYFLNAILFVLRDFLKKIDLISKLKKENLYNDLIEILLSKYLHPFTWEVTGQSRNGFSKNKKDAGLIDIEIKYSGNPKTFCEAFRIKGIYTNKIQSHVEKTIFNYNTIGCDVIFIIVYYEGDNFNVDWKKYKDFIKNNIDYKKYTCFPADDNVKHDYGHNIKVCKVNHKDDDVNISVFHIFINLNP